MSLDLSFISFCSVPVQQLACKQQMIKGKGSIAQHYCAHWSQKNRFSKHIGNKKTSASVSKVAYVSQNTKPQIQT